MELTVREHQIGGVNLACLQVVGPRSNDDVVATLETYGKLLRAAHANGQRVILILDFSRVGPMDAQQRGIAAEWLHKSERLMNAAGLGVAIITADAMIRGAMTAIDWLNAPIYPKPTVDTFEQALFWAFAMCEHHGVRLSENDRRDCRLKLSGGRM